MGENVKGSCGVVAIGQLLSYYDNYLSDDIISDVYDIEAVSSSTNFVSLYNSPGILNDKPTQDDLAQHNVSTVSALTTEQYLNIMQEYANTSLHAKLISIAKDLGYYDEGSSHSTSLGMTYSEIYSLLDYWLVVNGFNNNYSIVRKTGDSNTVKRFIQDNISLGYPVIALVRSSVTNSGHAAVCYDYDSNNIYANMGWTGNSIYTHYPIESRYDIYTGAIVLKFSPDNHTHTNNYIVEKYQAATYYCYCNGEILTYKETHHPYNDHCEHYNDLFHKSYCWCGEYILNEHNWIAMYPSLTTCYEQNCSECGDSSIVHKYSYIKYDNHQHIKSCDCSGNRLEGHTWIRINDMLFSCICGATSRFVPVIHQNLESDIISQPQIANLSDGEYVIVCDKFCIVKIEDVLYCIY